MSGKWHITRHTDADGPKHSWPCQRGFDRFFGIITGAANFWKPQTLTRDNERITVDEFPEDFFLTDAISDQAADYIREHAQTNGDQPFFLYTAYTAPHWAPCTRTKKILQNTKIVLPRDGINCAKSVWRACAKWAS